MLFMQTDEWEETAASIYFFHFKALQMVAI